jgi:ABC-type sugar transport system ATPase subunit
MCDRFLVLHQGRVARILTPAEADEALVLAYAMGEHPDD